MTRLDPTTPGSPCSALYLAVACELAYAAEPEGREFFRSRLGLDARLISVDNTQVYVGENDSSIVVAFRGSESPHTLDGLKDWLITNANNFLIIPEGQIGTDFAAAGVGARFHKGFLQALGDVWDPLVAAVDGAHSAAERPVWVTGHSLGGALALLAAWRFLRHFIPVHEIHTYGAPMIGNRETAEAFGREFPNRIYRYVNDLDIVPLLPTVSLTSNSYAHCLTELVLSGASEIGSASEAVKGLASDAADGLLNVTVIDNLWSFFKDRIDYHLLPGYQQRIKERFGDPA